MRIKYVVSSMIFWWRENRLTFEQDCQLLKSRGFGVELWPNIRGENDCRYERQNWPRLVAATEGMVVSMLSRNDNTTLKQWSEQIECAKLLGADIVTDLRSFGVPESSEIDGFDFAAEVVKLAQDSGVRLCLETGELVRLLRVGKRFEGIWYCLDTGHAYLSGESSFKQYVDELAPRIGHLHLTDNYGRRDDHAPPGLRGGMPRENWEYLLEVLSKYDNELIAALEIYPSMPDVLIRQASEYLFGELNWPDPPQRQYVSARNAPADSAER
jgi:sugar phosphate isomerase/epimerase